MGEARQGGRHQVGHESLSAAARVIPSIATFAVDQGFWYLIPAGLQDRIQVGTMVRIPLSGRRVRGFVVELDQHDPTGLKEIAGVSGDFPVFTPLTLTSLTWAADHYISPMAVMLERAAPPNLPRRMTVEAYSPVAPEGELGSLGRLAFERASGKPFPPTALVTRSGRRDWIRDLAPLLGADQSTMVIVATVLEASMLADTARPRFGRRVVLAAGDSDKEITSAWVAAQEPGTLLIGTPRLAAWTIPSLALVVVVEEGRRAMKDRQTPTVSVRDLVVERSRREDVGIVMVGPTPTVEVLSSGARVVQEGTRAWSLVELVDRSTEPPGSGYLAERTVGALKGALNNEWATLVFTHRRSGDESLRCVSCRAVRLCSRCGSRLSTGPECRRCGLESSNCSHCGGAEFEAMGTIPQRLADTLSRHLGSDNVGLAPSRRPVIVGTERDLAGADGYDLIVVADADGLSFGHDYRSGEEALRILARLGNLVRPGTGRRLMIQTSVPDSSLMETMKAGDPVPYLEAVLAERARDGLPPASEILVIEVRGEGDLRALGSDLAADGVVVMGPAATADGVRWLLQGDMETARPHIRELVRIWRDRGLTVRIDADPIDL